MDIAGTLAYYNDKLGFKCLGTWQDPPVYAIVARDQHAIHFRCAAPPTANPGKYADELLDAYILIEDADALYAGSRITRHAESGKRVTRDNGLDAISGGLSSILPRGLQKAAGGHLSTWDAICRFVGCSSRYMDVPESS